MIRRDDFLLLRIAALGWLTAARRLTGIGWYRWLGYGVPLAIIVWYGFLLIGAEAHRGAAMAAQHAALVLRGGALLCAVAGYGAGRSASARWRKSAAAAWLIVLPLSDRRRRAVILAVSADGIARGAAFCLLSWLALPMLPGSPPADWLGLVLALFGAGWGFGVWIGRRDSVMPSSVEVTATVPSRCAAPLWRHTEQLAPRWVGLWAILSRLRRVLIWFAATFVAGIGIAAAADHDAAAGVVVPGFAVIASLGLLVLAIDAAPMLSPVLRTTPLRFHAAGLALLRLPVALASLWLGAFGLIAVSVGWISVGQCGLIGVAATGLGLMYAMTALSLPGAPRLALGFYLMALALVGDNYGALQNVGFLAMLIVIVALLARTRSLYRHGG
ncbi:hypothetical protein [Acidiphilium sp.]|uniref:hypothetical protein n=1 Tax=Acidiphilium sp. TaxID=527 RepID=UPI003D059980